MSASQRIRPFPYHLLSFPTPFSPCCCPTSSFYTARTPLVASRQARIARSIPGALPHPMHSSYLVDSQWQGFPTHQSACVHAPLVRNVVVHRSFSTTSNRWTDPKTLALRQRVNLARSLLTVHRSALGCFGRYAPSHRSPQVPPRRQSLVLLLLLDGLISPLRAADRVSSPTETVYECDEASQRSATLSIRSRRRPSVSPLRPGALPRQPLPLES